MKQALLAILFIASAAASRPSCYERPIQVIYPDSAHAKLHINESGVQELAPCLESRLALLGVVGPYHSGKSFLLNQLAGRQAFKVGASVEPETLGIWMLPLEQRSPDGAQVVLVDTEGFFGTNVAEYYDANIFAITALLSSQIVYNSIKLIDQAAVDYMELLAQRTRLFSLRSSLVPLEENHWQSHLPFEFPPLTWVVEDFVQDLGQRSPLDWLQSFFEAKRDANQPDGLAEVLSEVDCRTLFLPATSLVELRDLSSVPSDRLTSEFRTGVEQLRSDLVARMPESRFGAGGLVSFLRMLVSAANRDLFPQLPDYWNVWMHSIADIAKSDAVIYYRQRLDGALVERDVLPEAELERQAALLREDTQAFFRQLVFNSAAHYSNKEVQSLLNASLLSVSSEYSERNRVRLRQLCDRKFKDAQDSFDAFLGNLSQHNPQSESSLVLLCANRSAVELLTVQLPEFTDSSAFKDALQRYREHSKFRCDQAVDENRKALQHTLNSVLTAVQTSYTAAISAEKRQAETLSDQALGELETRVVSVAEAEMKRQVEDGPLHWLAWPDDRELAKPVAEMRAGLQKALERLRAENEEAVWRAVQRNGERGLETVRADVRRSLPRSRRSIDEQLAKRRTEFSDENTKFYEAWGARAARKTRLASWTEQRFEEIARELREENQRIYEKMFGESTRQCRRKALQEFHDYCPYCRFLMPWNNRANFDAANRYCLQQVQEREKQVVPEEVADEMLAIWAANELDQTPLVIWGISLLGLVAGLAFRFLK